VRRTFQTVSSRTSPSYPSRFLVNRGFSPTRIVDEQSMLKAS
jgi:hypothetical protein